MRFLFLGFKCKKITHSEGVQKRRDFKHLDPMTPQPLPLNTNRGDEEPQNLLPFCTLSEGVIFYIWSPPPKKKEPLNVLFFYIWTPKK